MYRDAETLYRETLGRKPASWTAHNNPGVILAERPNRVPEAISEFEASLRLNLADALLSTPGRMPEAIPHLQAALTLNPNFPETHCDLALALSTSGRIPEAIAEYKRRSGSGLISWRRVQFGASSLQI
jgi:tetratricopeptide (TPR) repeat protein